MPPKPRESCDQLKIQKVSLASLTAAAEEDKIFEKGKIEEMDSISLSSESDKGPSLLVSEWLEDQTDEIPNEEADFLDEDIGISKAVILNILILTLIFYVKAAAVT